MAPSLHGIRAFSDCTTLPPQDQSMEAQQTVFDDLSQLLEDPDAFRRWCGYKGIDDVTGFLHADVPDALKPTVAVTCGRFRSSGPRSGHAWFRP